MRSVDREKYSWRGKVCFWKVSRLLLSLIGDMLIIDIEVIETKVHCIFTDFSFCQHINNADRWRGRGGVQCSTLSVPYEVCRLWVKLGTLITEFILVCEECTVDSRWLKPSLTRSNLVSLQVIFNLVNIYYFPSCSGGPISLLHSFTIFDRTVSYTSP